MTVFGGKVFGGKVRGARWWAVLSLAAIGSLWSPAARASTPVPYIDSVSPAAAATGAAGSISLTVYGGNFTSTPATYVQVTLDGATTSTPLATTVVSGTQLTATLPASETAKDGTAFVTVVNGTLVSNAVELPITHSASSLTFRETQQDPSGGNHAYAPPVLADFNNDGKPDIAVSYNGGAGNYGVSVFLGNGSGSFQGAEPLAPTGNLPEGLAAADFNGDGKMDLAVANAQDGSITILLGNGDGTFQTGINTTLTTGSRPYLVAAGDFNGDGILDLAVACRPGSGPQFVTVLLGTSTPGTFQAPVNYGNIGQVAGLAIADFDGDGTLDLAISDAANNEIWILSGNGDGTFSSGTAFPTQSGPAGIVAADLNGDGQTDLAVAYPAASQSQLSVLVNNTQTAGTLAFLAHQEYATGGAGSFLAAADLNGDGIVDLAEPNLSSNTVSVLLGNGDGTFESFTSFTVDAGFDSIIGVATADLNADGRIDLAFTAVQQQNSLAVVSVLLQTPQITISPTSLNFSSQLKGTESSAQTVTLTYTGGPALTFYSFNTVMSPVSEPTSFSETNVDCPLSPAVLAYQASCTINVYFTPGASGSLSGQLQIADNITGQANPQVVSLSGTGEAPLAGVSIPSLTFGNQLVGSTSVSQNVTLSNSGNGTLTITGIAVSNGFSQTNTCGGSVAASSTCTVSVSFAPTASGAANGTLTVTDNSGETSGSTQTVSLTGSAIAPAGLAPASLTFTNQLVSTTSAIQTLTVSNTNSTALSITSVTITGANGSDFGETSTCGSSLAAGANCTISVSFKPTATGTRSATVMVAENASGAASSTQSTALSGTGVAPVAGLASSTLTFASQMLGSTSAVEMLTLSNTGTAALTITSVTVTGANSGDFGETNTCGSSVAAGASCTISVSFTPSANGARSATLTVTDNSSAVSSSTQTASLSGSGVSPQASLAPASLTFAGQLVGTTSTAQAVTLSNTGTAALALVSINTNGNFAQTSNCGTSVAAGASCAINVTLAPASAGTLTGSLTITDNSAGAAASTQTVSLTGTGTKAGVKLSAASLTFGNENVGAASAGQAVTITNNGTATLTLTSITAGGDFSQSNACGSSLPAGASCTVTVTFKPTAIFSRAATLTVTDNASPATQTVSLSGTGVGADPNVSPSSLAFSGQLVGATSTAQVVTLKNVGNAAMTVADMAASGDFFETSTCGASLPVNASCTISVTFKPTAGGTRSGALTLSADGSHSIALSGAGQDFSFAGTATGSVSPGQSASYNLSATPEGGLDGAIALSCSGAPSEATCTVSPNSVMLNGSGATNFQVTVSTTASSGLAPLSRMTPPSAGDRGKWLLLGLVVLAGMMLLARRRPEAMVGRLRLGLATAGMVLVLALGIAACGGSSSAPSSSNLGTPTGKYSLTVTGTLTSGSVTVSHDVQVTLQVQ